MFHWPSTLSRCHHCDTCSVPIVVHCRHVLKGPCHTCTGNPLVTSPEELIASWIACHKNFLNLLGISAVTESSLRGVLPTERFHSLFVTTIALEATQGGANGVRQYQRVSWPWAISLHFFFECVRISTVERSLSPESRRVCDSVPQHPL